jgi:hypothetical protein
MRKESWKEIEAALGIDARELRRIFAPRRAQLISDETNRRLNQTSLRNQLATKRRSRTPKPGV